MIIYLFIISFSYFLLIIGFAYFFKLSLSERITVDVIPSIRFSVIIAARNEAHQIQFLLDALRKQSYDRNLFEVIVADDSSTDNTVEIIKNFINDNPDIDLKLLQIETEENKPTFKKNALTRAINMSEGDVIITTDADCVFDEDWLLSISKTYMSNKTKLIVGMIAYHNDKNTFEKMQHLEFLSLIASGIGSLRMGYPTMCNAANLIFERKAFFELDGYKSDKKIASGDDVLFLLKIKKKYGISAISFITDKKSIVYTSACKTVSEFINQRIRWASKAKVYRDIPVILVAAIVFVFNVTIGILFLSAYISVNYLLYALLLFIIKVIVDFPVLYLITTYINRRDLLKFYLPLQFLYFPYVMIIGSLSLFMPYKWKGRTVKI